MLRNGFVAFLVAAANLLGESRCPNPDPDVSSLGSNLTELYLHDSAGRVITWFRSSGRASEILSCPQGSPLAKVLEPPPRGPVTIVADHEYRVASVRRGRSAPRRIPESDFLVETLACIPWGIDARVDATYDAGGRLVMVRTVMAPRSKLADAQVDPAMRPCIRSFVYRLDGAIHIQGCGVAVCPICSRD